MTQPSPHRTLMQLHPEQGLAVVFMTNSEWAKLDRFADLAWRELVPR